MEVIHAHIFDPKNSLFKWDKNDKAEAYVVKCEMSDKCELFKIGQCIRRKPLGGRCVYGKHANEVGYTSRAQKYYQWINDKKEKYKDAPSLAYPSDRFARVGDYIWVPYAHANFDNGSIPFLEKGMVFSSGLDFIHKDDWNLDTVLALLDHRPHAMMGGEIRDYQNKIVPLMLFHLKSFDSDLFAKAQSARPDKKPLPVVGQKARLVTVNPCAFKLRDKEYNWDGEKVTCENPHSLLGLLGLGLDADKGEPARVEFVPRRDSYIVIENEDQVNPDTEFV